VKRGVRCARNNKEVRRTGIGELMEDRATDFDKALAQRRYRVFKEQTWDAPGAEGDLPLSLVNAQGLVRRGREEHHPGARYQSTLELDPRTVDRLRAIPVASEIVVHARQELVRRLDSYELEHAELFSCVAGFVERKIMPIIIRHAISGTALVNTEDAVLDDPLALAMLIDHFLRARLPRGGRPPPDRVPEHVDLKTGAVRCRMKKVFRIQIRFTGSEIRRG